MTFLKEPEIAQSVSCPYIEGKEFIQEYFYAYDLNEREFDEFVSAGWRRFGLYFFRPACSDCKKCIPIRIPCSGFKPSKSQRRVLRKNHDTSIRLSPPRYSDEIFEIYQKHSKIKFGLDSEKERFKESFFTAAVPSAQSEYYINGKLAGVGFLDISKNALSSVYFVYDPDFSSFSPGVFSILKEIEIVRELGISYYNLGYWIQENNSMAYKGNYHPHQIYSWKNKLWSDETETMSNKKEIKSE